MRSGQKGPEGAAGAAADAPGARGTRPAGAVLPEKGVRGTARQHRIRHAVSLLEQTDQSIARIGAACGFDDMSYFARIFRAERGCTPSEYREKLRK